MLWVRVHGLGTWMLGRVLRRPCADWQAKYGHGIAPVETFVERDGFRGTSYQAANWQSMARTPRRTRRIAWLIERQTLSCRRRQ